MKTLIGIIIALAVLGGGYYLFVQTSSENGEAVMEDTHEGDTMMEDEGSAMMEKDGEALGDGSMMEDNGAMMEEEAVKKFTVEGGKFYFSPATMTVKKGDTVRITFKNVDGFHDFIIDEFSVATKQINTGEEATVEFVADKAGTFNYYCSVGNHRQLGMEGTLTVE